ncbi:ATP-binding protein [Kitasatospora purpeofusca]|uniref:ATP-binding protein n=1 Tax=Kitasatospora purpeofusca TaxID=67352 RepID=UPI0004BF0A0B|nr:ATP-binding protein [Kitasatospora purpeofusca]
MPETGLEQARTALYAYNPSALLGFLECRWLDAKGAPYELKSPSAVEELAKDIASFANSTEGGVIVLGIGTRLENGQEILDRLLPFDRSSVDLDQMRKLLRERITPAPRNVSIEWIEHGGPGQGIVFIDVPPQAVGNLPHVVAAPNGKPGQVNPVTVAVPLRESDGTHWLPRTEVQRLLSLGLAVSGAPSRTLHDLVDKLTAGDKAEPRYHVGQGAPGREVAFRRAYDGLGGSAVLGEPTAAAYEDGPGLVQHFAALGDKTGWVLCALPGRSVVAVAEPLWQHLLAGGSGAPGGQALAAVGFPAPPAGGTPTALLEDAETVELVGGAWGPGQLTVTTDGEPIWRPTPAISFDLPRAAGNWTADAPAPKLRVRALATLPWAAARELEVIPERRRTLLQALPFCPLAAAARTLSLRHGVDMPMGMWAPGPHRNAADAVSYSSTRHSEDGPALTAAVMLALPNATDSAVVSCAEVRLEGTAAQPAAPEARASRPYRILSLEEVEETLLAAWRTATEVLPSAVGDTNAPRPWSQPPTVLLQIATGSPHGTAAPSLDRFVDLAPFGSSDRAPLTEMSVTITADPQLTDGKRRLLLRRALVRMAQAFGYIDAAEDRF